MCLIRVFTVCCHLIFVTTARFLNTFDVVGFNLINGIVVASLLCVMVAMILMRAVNKDISRYNAIDLAACGFLC